MYRLLIILTLGVMGFVSCQKKGTDQQPVVANFSSALLDATSNKIWTTGDSIGVYMVTTTSASLAIPIKGSQALNTPYFATTGGSTQTTFSPSPTHSTIFFPGDGTIVDFYAYYPYSATGVSDGIYSADVSGQRTRDVALACARVSGASQKNPDVEFSFANQFIKLIFNLTSSKSTESLQGLEARVTGHYNTASVNLRSREISGHATLQDIPLWVSSDGTVAQAILIPWPAGQPQSAHTVVFTQGDQDMILDISSVNAQAGQQITLNVKLGEVPVIVGDAQINPWGDGTGGDIEAND